MAFAKYPVSGSSGGDVTGPSSSVNNGVVLFNGTSGKVIKDLGVGSANQVLLTNGTTPSFGAITNAYIDSGAAIALSKLAALTASRALVSNGSGVISVSSVTDTELGYVSGVTSAIQTQLNSKANDSAVVHISGTETITGAKTFSSIIASSLTSNQFIAGNVTLSFTNSGTPTTITIPNVAPFATIPLLENAQTFTAQQSFSNNIVVQNRVIVFGTSQTITILGSTPASSRFVTIPEAGADSDFVLTAGSQTIGGSKTFSSAVAITTTTNQLILGTTNTVTISSTAPAASRVYTIPDAGAAADFILSAGTQTVGGSKTFSSAVTINPASNQVILSSGVNQLTLNSGTSAAARTYTVPDTGTTDTFAMLGGAQTFTALKTFNSGLAIAGGAAANNTLWVASNILNIRGGTSGTDIYNSSGTVVVDITDAGVVTLGPANSSLVHITNGSGLSVRNNGASGGYVDGRQSGTAQWFVGKHSYNVFSGSSFGIGAVVAGLGVEFAAGNAIAGSISAAGAWTLGNLSANVTHSVLSTRASTSDGVVPLLIQVNAGLADQRYLQCYHNSSVPGGGLARSGATNNITLFNPSDRRIKTNLSEIIVHGCLSKIKAVKLRKYDWKTGGTGGFGPIAQELYEVYPEKVTKSDEGLGDEVPEGVTPWSVQESWSYELMGAIQELAAKNDELEAKLDALKAS